METTATKTVAALTVAAYEATECYAVPGADTLIDMIHPATGLTCIYGRTLDDVRREYPTAERMTYEAWAAAKAERQNCPFTWESTAESHYDEMLECLPPACLRGNGFLVGEPWDHETLTGAPRFQAFRRSRGLCYVATRPLTRKEFLAALNEPIR
jgi:hypothetical protein